MLRRLQRYTYDEFVAEPERYGSAERFLHLAIEALMDMGNHVIAEMALGMVNWYSDIPAILTEKGYLRSSRTANGRNGSILLETPILTNRRVSEYSARC